MNRRRFLWLALLLTVCLQTSANRGGFYYKNISIEAVVHENNVWDVTETFDIFFKEPRHGFYRYLPKGFKMKQKVKGEKGLQEFRYVCDIDDIDVDEWKYTTGESNNEFCIIRIGDADYEVSGDQQYVISYTYSYPNDRLDNKDFLFHTVLGTDFEDPIHHLDFKITFDKELPDDIDERLKVFAGEYGKTDGMIPSLTVNVSTDEITGSADDISPRHGVTLYAELPEGYYEGVPTVNYTWFYICLLLTFLVILAIVYFQLQQKTPHITKVIEFYPPEEISSGEVGTIIDGSVDSIDITSLIPWLAGQGYISIKELKKGKLFKYTDLELTKLKDLPKTAPSYQKLLMNLLFCTGDVVNMKEIGQHPKQYNDVKGALNDHFEGDRQLTKLKKPFWLYVLLAVFGTLTLGFNSVVSTFDTELFCGSIVTFGVPCMLAAIIRVKKKLADKLRSSFHYILLLVVKAALMVCSWLLYSTLYTEYGAPLNRWMVLALFIVCFILNELAGRFNVDTDYRVQMMGRLLGFKEFIKTAEKPRLEQLQADDPQYFYKVLPYAMVFKLTNQWEDLFKDIKVEKPEWYDSATPLMGYSLTHNMVHNFSSTASSAITTISHSSSGGSSGGGFSGGGGGGGGGGSW